MNRYFRTSLVVLVLAAAGCSLDLDEPAPPAVVARFDPAAGVIPLPSDVVRDAAEGHLALPIEDDMTKAEAAFRRFLNGLDAWSTTFPGEVEFTGAIDRGSVTTDTLEIWEWGVNPRRLEWQWADPPPAGTFTGPTVALDREDTRLVINPPRAGWAPGHRYVLLARGGGVGMRDRAGRPVGPDVAFYYLRLPNKLDEYRNQRAFPGATRAERLANAAALEEVRVQLDPYFDYFAGPSLPEPERIPREDVVALWSFTVTQRTELCMDEPSQRMPLPFDLLIDPATGLVALPAAPWDSTIEADGKAQANALDGFGVSANLTFELSRAVDPATATPDTVALYRLGEPPAPVPLERVMVMAPEGEAPCQAESPDAGCTHLVLVVADEALPLAPRARYAVVVSDGLHGADGAPVVPMVIGHFMRTEYPLWIDGQNQLEAVPDEDAARLEGVRAEIDALLTRLGREHVVTAWPFTTMDVLPGLTDAAGTAARLDLPADPVDVTTRTVDLLTRDDAFEGLFPGVAAQPVRDVYAGRLQGVAAVIEGAIRSPYFLDRRTRRWRTDGGHEVEKVRFVMTIPESARPGIPVPVVIFGHAVVTDRRFVLTIAGELAQKGFAAVSIDFPFHGERTVCVDASLVAIPNFLSAELQDLTGFHDSLIYLPPCVSGDKATCSDTGECLDENGNPEPLNSFLLLNGKPAVMDLKPASGAAFLDINDIPHIKDHFLQALVDLGALEHSLRAGDWSATGVELRTDRLYYAGQSLGAIIGAVYVAVDPTIRRAVLNVPGADLVDMFVDSFYFGPQIVDYFQRQDIPLASFEHERLLDVARWLIDSVDPHSVAHLYLTNDVPVLLQMDAGPPSGDLIIPNRTTRLLARVGGLPLREYPSSLHGDLVIPVVGDTMLADLAAFLAGEITQ